jgi:hypothetical protein
MVAASCSKRYSSTAPVLYMGMGHCRSHGSSGDGLGGGRLRLQRPMMTDVRIRTGEEKRLSPVVGPAHEIGRSSLAAHLDDLAVSHRTVEQGGCDHNPVAHYCFHRCSITSCRHIEQDALHLIKVERLHPQCRRSWMPAAGPEARKRWGPSSHRDQGPKRLPTNDHDRRRRTRPLWECRAKGHR